MSDEVPPTDPAVRCLVDPWRDRVALLEPLCYVPDVAILPRRARVDEPITPMSGLHPRFSAERAPGPAAAR